MEGIQDGDGFGQFVADRVDVAAEGIQRRCLGLLKVLLTLSPGRRMLPEASRHEVQQLGVNEAVSVAGVVHDPGDHPGAGRPGVGPDMFVDAERIQPLQPARVGDPPRGLCPDFVPGGVPGDAELVGQGRD
ncbi:hypothetical protein ABLI39_05175 [Pseudarthrobacter sp. B907]|uniref:hypothetical protein n=1 Tax=Pseudarthrobacter sp. B907 TaxID=3158261 RepID=UPI0032DA9E21